MSCHYQLSSPERTRSLQLEVTTYPADRFPMLLGAIWIGDLVIFIVCGNDVQQNSAAFEDLHLTTTFVLVGECRNATIWVDLEEPRLLLLMLAEV